MAAGALLFPSDHQIPVDYFITKGHRVLIGGELTAFDSEGNLFFRVHNSSSSKICSSYSGGRVKTVVDASGIPLISSVHSAHGEWKGFDSKDHPPVDFVFTVKKHSREYLEVFLAGQRCRFTVKGNTFQRACTMYRGDSIVAQSCLNYKLKKTIPPSRHKFRLTVFPGIDHALGRWAGWRRWAHEEPPNLGRAMHVPCFSIVSTSPDLHLPPPLDWQLA